MNSYCVIFRPRLSVAPMHYPRMKRCYLRADTADRAILIASADNPQWRVVGIEPGDMAAFLLERDCSGATQDVWHAA